MAKIRIKQINIVTREVTEMTMPGERIGPFGIHPSPEDTDFWTVTHLRTGWACQRLLPSRERAEWLARKLMAFGVWGHRHPDKLRAAIDADTLAQIKVLRADAMSGDRQGEIAA